MAQINLALFNRAIINTTETGQSDEYFFNKFDLSKIMRKKIIKRCDSDDENEDKEEEEEENDLIDYTNLDRSRVPVHQIPADAIALCDLKTHITYTGGKVISPVPGYYKLIFTLDFRQLYTSIMIFYCLFIQSFFGADNKLYLQRNENAITTKFLKEMADKRAFYKKEMKNTRPIRLSTECMIRGKCRQTCVQFPVRLVWFVL